MTKNFEVISFRMPLSETRRVAVSSSRVLPRGGSLTRGKRLNNVARHKGQEVSCDAKHPRHLREKRTEDPSAHFLPVLAAASSGVHSGYSPGKTYLGVLISFTRGPLPERKRKRKKKRRDPREERRTTDAGKRGEGRRQPKQKPVNRLRHVDDDTTKGKAVNFKLPPWPEAI